VLVVSLIRQRGCDVLNVDSVQIKRLLRVGAESELNGPSNSVAFAGALAAQSRTPVDVRVAADPDVADCAVSSIRPTLAPREVGEPS
jgi:hypothetical protein